jgi:hypothetical protein
VEPLSILDLSGARRRAPVVFTLMRDDEASSTFQGFKGSVPRPQALRRQFLPYTFHRSASTLELPATRNSEKELLAILVLCITIKLSRFMQSSIMK